MNHVRYAIRQWCKNPGFTVVVVLTLALGIGANSAIFTVVEAVLLHSLPYREPDRIIALWDYNPKRSQSAGAVATIGGPRLQDVIDQNHTFESVAYYYFLNSTLTQQGRLPERVKGFAVSGDFWRVMGIQPMLGRTFGRSSDAINSPDYTVLSYRLWEQQFGADRNIVGQLITLDGKASTVIGIMPREFNYPNGAEFWQASHFPLSQTAYRDDSSRFMSAVGRVKVGVSFEAAQNDLDVIARRLGNRYASTDLEWSFRIEPLRDALFGSIRPALAMLMAGVALVLLIACANVANLLLSRAAFRQREVAVQLALGCGTGRLIQQFLTESVLLSLAGGFLGLLIISPVVRVLSNELPKGRFDITSVKIDSTVVAFTFAVCTLTGMVLAMIPVLSVRHHRIQTVLKQSVTRTVGGEANKLRGTMIGAEVGLSFILLLTAGLLIQSFWKLQHLDLGFRSENVLTFEISFPWGTKPDQIRHFYQQVLDRISTLPGVQAVGSIQRLPLDHFSLTTPFWIEGQPRPMGGGNIIAETRTTGGNYFAAMGIPLLAGRFLTEHDSEPNASPVALIDKSMSDRFFPHQGPVGKRLLSDRGAVQIIGIVGAVRGATGDLQADPKSTIYVPERGWPMDAFAVRTAGSSVGLASSIRQVVRQLDPGKAVYNIQPMRQLANDAVAQPRVNAFLLSVFAFLALVLASVGVYGVTSYIVSERTREIGLRVALGAQQTEVIRLFIGQAIRWSLAGEGLGLLVGVALVRFMQSFLFDVAPYDVRTFVSVSLVLTSVVLLASYLSARRAAAVDPVVALRHE